MNGSEAHFLGVHAHFGVDTGRRAVGTALGGRCAGASSWASAGLVLPRQRVHLGSLGVYGSISKAWTIAVETKTCSGGRWMFQPTHDP